MNFLSRHFPRVLIRHLREECRFTVAKIAPGIYDVKGSVFLTRIIVTKELSTDDYLFLRCLTRNLAKESDAVTSVVQEFQQHHEDTLYREYIQQLSFANNLNKGATAMSKEKIPTIDFIYDLGAKTQRQKDEIEISELSGKLDNATTENLLLRKLLMEHGIPVPSTDATSKI